MREEEAGAGLLAITSPDRLHAGWLAAGRARRAGDRTATSHIETILAPLARDAALVTILDGHPAAHDWIGAVRGQRVVPLGVDRFGQSGDIPDLYGNTGWTWTRSWTPARRRCWAEPGAKGDRRSPATYQ